MRAEPIQLSLFLRADATPQIGLGHYMRCLALAEYCIGRGGSVTLLTRCQDDALLERAARLGMVVVPLAGKATDPEQLRKYTAGDDCAPERRWTVLDGYHFDYEYQEAARDYGRRLLMIDDLGDVERCAADVILNQNSVERQMWYQCAPAALVLAGPRYALLRGEFAAASRRRRTARRAKNLLVLMGGTDPRQLLARVLHALEGSTVGFREVRVVVGAGNPRAAELRSMAAQSRLPLRIIIAPASLAEQMWWADIAVSAAGSTFWELASMGVPSVLIVAAKNQEPIADTIRQTGAGCIIGDADTFTAEALNAALEVLAADRGRRTTMARAGRKLVDGRGAERVLDVLEALSSPGSPVRYVVRPVRADDALALLRLANDPSVRANAFNSAPISLADHLRWFERRLTSPDCRIWIFEVAGMLAAQIRYERIADDVAEIGFSVVSAFRGRGLGTRMLEHTWECACHQLRVERAVGFVLPENGASIRAFEKAGFTRLPDSRRHGRECCAFERRMSSTLNRAAP